MNAITYQLQHRFEDGWLDEGKPITDPSEARTELGIHRELWPDEYRVIRIKTKAMDW